MAAAGRRSSPTISRRGRSSSAAPVTPERRSAARCLALGHALAQALGGRYGAPHGALNALTLPPALRFNQPVAGEAIARFGRRSAPTIRPRSVEELARLGGFERLRDLGIPEAARAGGRGGGRRPAGREGEPARAVDGGTTSRTAPLDLVIASENNDG